MKKCDLCDEPVGDFICPYCGFVKAKIIDKDTVKVVEEAKKEKRKELLHNISEVGIVVWLFKGVKDEEPDFEKTFFPLLTSPSLNNGTITGISTTVNVKNGKDITFYMKTRESQKGVLLPKKLNLPGNLDTFYISVKINERLKLDVFYHAKNENPKDVKVFENIKLGETLVPKS